MTDLKFPFDIYQRVPGRFNVGALFSGPDPFGVSRTFINSWYGVKYRWLDCSEASEKYTQAAHAILNSNSIEVDPDQYLDSNYVLERELFSFLYLGLSAIEVLVYGIYFMASSRYPLKFPMHHKNISWGTDSAGEALKEKALKYQKIDLENVSRRFCEELPADPLSEALRRLQADPDLKRWKVLRNEFTHRCNPQRVSFETHDEHLEYLISIGQSEMARNLEEQRGAFLEFMDGERVRLDEHTTAARLIWLEQTLSELIAETSDFIDRHFPKAGTH